MDEIINYIDLCENEKDICLKELLHTSFATSKTDIKALKNEMEKSVKGHLPQFILVRKNNTLIGYMFLIGENRSSILPWLAVENSEELPPKTGIRLLEYAIELCNEAKEFKLAEMLKDKLKKQK